MQHAQKNAEQARQDSIAEVARLDSIARVQADSIKLPSKLLKQPLLPLPIPESGY